MPHLTRKGHGRQSPGSLNPTTKAGTYSNFDKWYQPIPIPEDPAIFYREFDDPEWERHKTGDLFRYVWTIVDCDGRMYLLPGFHFVNRFNWVLCAVPWQDDENRRSGYVW